VLSPSTGSGQAPPRERRSRSIGRQWPQIMRNPYNPFRAARSGGFEGMALSVDGRTLLPLLEQPLAHGEAKTLLIHEFDIASRSYTGTRFTYPLDPRGTAIGVLNDNNFPFSIGRHVGTGQPDDNEFIVIQLDQPLGSL